MPAKESKVKQFNAQLLHDCANVFDADISVRIRDYKVYITIDDQAVPIFRKF